MVTRPIIHLGFRWSYRTLCSYLLKLSVWDVLSLIFHASLASSGDQHCWHPEILFLSTIEEKSAGMNHGGLRHRCHMASLFSVELRPLGCPGSYKSIIGTLCCCSVIAQALLRLCCSC